MASECERSFEFARKLSECEQQKADLELQVNKLYSFVFKFRFFKLLS